MHLLLSNWNPKSNIECFNKIWMSCIYNGMAEIWKPKLFMWEKVIKRHNERSECVDSVAEFGIQHIQHRLTWVNISRRLVPHPVYFWSRVPLHFAGSAFYSLGVGWGVVVSCIIKNTWYKMSISEWHYLFSFLFWVNLVGKVWLGSYE